MTLEERIMQIDSELTLLEEKTDNGTFTDDDFQHLKDLFNELMGSNNFNE